MQYKCDICDFSTSAQNGLSLHKRRLHKLDKNNEAVTQLDNPDFHNRDPKKYRHQCLRCTRRYKKIHHLGPDHVISTGRQMMNFECLSRHQNQI